VQDSSMLSFDDTLGSAAEESNSSEGRGFSFIFFDAEVLGFSVVCTGSGSGAFSSGGK